MTKKAVEMVGGRYETESSGGITFDTLRDYAECGVDFYFSRSFDSLRERIGHEL